MYSPIFDNKKNSLIYGLVWLVIAIIQANFLFLVSDVEAVAAILDAAVFSLTFYVLSRAIWSVVRVAKFDRINYFNSIVTHLAAALLIITIWYNLSYQLLNFISLAINLEAYFLFLDASKYLRIFLGLFFYLLTILNFYIVIMAEERKETDLREVRLLNNVKQAELEMLKSQLNPHFIFNSLNSISALTIIEPKNAQRMIVLLSEFLRYSLRSTNELVPFKEELQATQKYLAIEKVRFEDKLAVDQSIETGLDEFLLPSLILQPIVENAIKYGVHESLTESVLKLEACRENQLLRITISNDFDPNSSLRKGEGVGLKNVRERLKTIYELEDLLQIDKSGGVFKVILKIPRKSSAVLNG
jgi:sensor histidine kinase YesM